MVNFTQFYLNNRIIIRSELNPEIFSNYIDSERVFYKCSLFIMAVKADIYQFY